MSGRSPKRIQPEFFRLPSPLVQSLGVAFFQSLPECPGVYFFHDSEDRLLYVGQSGNLKKRIGSYRFVSADRHPRRTLRLIRRVHRITWRTCAAASEAIALEASLLLELRPAFNRAGVWLSPPVHVQLLRTETHWELRLRPAESAEPPKPPQPPTTSLERATPAQQMPPVRPAASLLSLLSFPSLPAEDKPTLSSAPCAAATAAATATAGPFRASFRYAFPSLLRVLHAVIENRYHPWEFPCGLTRATVAPEHAWPHSPAAGEHFPALTAFLTQGDPTLLETCRTRLATQSLSASTLAWWEEQFETLQPYLKPGSVIEAKDRPAY